MRVRRGERHMSFRKYEEYKDSGVEWLGDSAEALGGRPRN